MMMMTEASDQLILTFGSKTHSGLLTEKKRRDSNGNGHYKVLDSIDFYLEFRFYCCLPAQLVAYSYTQICSLIL